MKNGKLGRTLLAAAAVILVASLSVGSALAYFTTYCTASGSVPMKMGFTETVPKEEVDLDGKHVTIANTGDYDCFVRVKVFAPDSVTLKYSSDTVWTQKDDGYWYYNAVLEPDKETPKLLISYTLPTISDEEKEDGYQQEINIVVVYECTPVLYDEEGNPYADWENVVTVQESAGDGAQTDDTEAGNQTEQEEE